MHPVSGGEFGYLNTNLSGFGMWTIDSHCPLRVKIGKSAENRVNACKHAAKSALLVLEWGQAGQVQDLGQFIKNLHASLGELWIKQVILGDLFRISPGDKIDELGI